MDSNQSNDALMMPADHDKASKEGSSSNNNNDINTDNDNDNDFLEPLKGIKDTFQRVGKIFYERGLSILGPSTLAICCWYLVAIGIRSTFMEWSAQSSEYRTIDIGGEEYGYVFEPKKVTISRLGLCLELLVIFLFHCPAEATTIATIANLYASNNNNNSIISEAEGKQIINNNNNQVTSSSATLCGRVGGIFTPCTAIETFVRLTMNRQGKILGTLLMACLLWCLALLLPMCILIWILAPEATYYYENIQWLYLPYLPKLLGGSLYLAYSTIFILVTYFLNPIIVWEQSQPIREKSNNNSQANNGLFHLVMTSFQQSFEIMKRHWKFVSSIVLVWFVIKLIVTKIVTVFNIIFYLDDVHAYKAWYMLGIPLHPIRVLYSNTDLWEIGRSWISVPFVIFIAAFGSIFKTVLYFDLRVKKEQDGSYTTETLKQELIHVIGRTDQETGETTPYTNMMDEETGKNQKAMATEIV